MFIFNKRRSKKEEKGKERKEEGERKKKGKRIALLFDPLQRGKLLK